MLKWKFSNLQYPQTLEQLQEASQIYHRVQQMKEELLRNGLVAKAWDELESKVARYL